MPFLRAAVCVLAAFSASFALPAVAQENWPTKPLRLIIPFPAGGSSDQLGRVMAKELGQKLVTETAANQTLTANAGEMLKFLTSMKAA